MARDLRPATSEESLRLDNARYSLKAALLFARAAGCPQTAKAIRRALKSADGARRHMARRRARTIARSALRSTIYEKT